MTIEAQTGEETATAGVSFRYEVRDFIHAYRLSTRPGPRRAALLALAIAAIFGAILWYEPDWDARLAACASGAVGGLAIFLLHRYVYLPLYARRLFANYPMLRVERSLSLEPDGLRDVTDRTNALLVWRDFVHWRADDKSVLLYTSPRLFIVVPARLAQQGFPVGELKSALARDFAQRHSARSCNR